MWRAGMAQRCVRSSIVFGLLLLLLACSTQARRMADIIQTDASCYTMSSESIRVEYSTRMPSLQNLLAIVDAQNRTLRSLWTCGSHDDACPDRQQGFTFQNLDDLKPGQYRIHLKSYGYHGHVVELQSETFEVTDGSCQVKDSVKVVRTVDSSPQFTSDSTLEVQFTRRIPRQKDVIGIFPVAVHNISTTQPLLWAWTCSADEDTSRGCQRASSSRSGTISFSLDTFPTGAYKAVLGKLSPSTQLIKPIKSSEPFFVIDTKLPPTYRRLEELPCGEISVETSKSYYLPAEDIPISFHRNGCDDGAKENVAIYDANTELSYYHATRLSPPPPFIWFCKSDDCPRDDFEWPLPSGFYKAVLVRILEQKHYYFESTKFQVDPSLGEPVTSPRRLLRSEKPLTTIVSGS